MMNSLSKIITPFFIGIFLVLGSMTFSLIARLNLPIISVIVVTLFFSEAAARNWAIFIGVLYEIISPYPFLVMFVAIYLCFALARTLGRSYISHRTILGSTVAGIILLFAYEAIVYILAAVGQIWANGWRPDFNQTYAIFVGMRMMVGALVLIIVFLIIRHFSAQKRGTIVQLGR